MKFKGNASDLREGARIVTNIAEVSPRADRAGLQSAAEALIVETERDDLPKLRMKQTGEQLELPPSQTVAHVWRQGKWRVIVMWVPDWSPNKWAGKYVLRIDCLCEEER